MAEAQERFQKFHSLARCGVNISVKRKPRSHSVVSLFSCQVQILLPKSLKADLSTLPSSFKRSVPFSDLLIDSKHLRWIYQAYLSVSTCVCAQSLRLCLFATSWTVACQANLSMGSSSLNYWSGLPLLTSGDLSDPGMEPVLLHLLHCKWILNH